MAIIGKPVLSQNFTFSIDGNVVNKVIKITNVEQEVAIVETRSGDAKYTTKQPGRLEPIRIQIQKISDGKDEFGKWRSLVTDTGEPQRCSMSIGLCDRSNKPVGEFVFMEAYPVSWKLLPLSATESGHALEVLEIMTERIDYKAS
jgi:phage tail-like protein